MGCALLLYCSLVSSLWLHCIVSLLLTRSGQLVYIMHEIGFIGLPYCSSVVTPRSLGWLCDVKTVVICKWCMNCPYRVRIFITVIYVCCVVLWRTTVCTLSPLSLEYVTFKVLNVSPRKVKIFSKRSTCTYTCIRPVLDEFTDFHHQHRVVIV